MKNNLFRVFPVIVFSLSSIGIYSQPVFPDIENWKKTQPVTYTSDNLWEYINGAADYYLNYGFSKLVVTEYQRTEDEYIKLEVYEQKSLLDAFGIYAYERFPQAGFIDVGAEGYSDHSALNFYTGHWYIKIHSHQSDVEALKAINDMAFKFCELNRCSKEIPKEIQGLSTKNSLKHTEKYFPDNFLGYSFLNMVVSVDYITGELKQTLFISRGDQNQVLETLQKYLDFAKTGKTAQPEDIYEIDDFFNGKVFLKVSGNSLFGIVGNTDMNGAKQVFDELIGSI